MYFIKKAVAGKLNSKTESFRKTHEIQMGLLMISKWAGQSRVSINDGDTCHVTEATRGINMEVVWPMVLAKNQMIPFILVFLYLNWSQLVLLFYMRFEVSKLLIAQKITTIPLKE